MAFYLQFLLCVVCAAQIIPALNANSVLPGAQVRLTNAGFDYGVDLAVASLTKLVRKSTIPAVHGSGHDVEYDLTELKITNFQVSQKSLRPVSKAGIRWVIGGLTVSLTGAFHYKWHKAFIHISDHGTFDVGASSMSLNLLVVITDSASQPKLSAASCDCHIGDLHLKFTGGKAKWIYNIVASLAKGKIKDIIQKAVCEQAKKAVNEDGNTAMKKLKMTTPIAHKFSLNYGLTQTPLFTGDYMQTYHKGEVFWADDIREAPYLPAQLPPLSNTTKMVYVWLSEYIANTFSYSAFTHQFLHYNLSANDLPAKSRHYLNTTCGSSLQCIGAIIPQIGSKYPNCTVKIAINATEPPRASIVPSNLGVDGQGEARFYAINAKGEQSYMLHLGMKLSITATGYVNDDKLYAHVKEIKLTFHVIESRIGFVSDEILDMVSKMAIRFYAIPKLNEMGEKGFNLPVTGAVRFKDPKLTLVKGAIIIGSDVLYKSSEEEAQPKSPWMDEVKTFEVVDNREDQHRGI